MLLAAAILGALLVVLPADELLEAIARLEPWMWAAAVAGYLGLHLLGVAKWRMLVNAGAAGLPFAQAVRCYYTGLFGNLFLPSLVGGDVVRLGLALKLVRSRTGLVLGSILDRMLDVVALAGLAGVGTLLVPAALSTDTRRIFGGLALVLAAGAAVATLVLLLARKRLRSFGPRRRLVHLRRAWRSLRGRPVQVLGAFALALTLQGLLVLLTAWLGRGIGLEVPLVVWIFVWPLAKIAALAPITQGGIGVRETAQVVLFAPFGVGAVAAVAVGLVFEVVIVGGALLAGALALAIGYFSRSAGSARGDG